MGKMFGDNKGDCMIVKRLQDSKPVARHTASPSVQIINKWPEPGRSPEKKKSRRRTNDHETLTRQIF